MLNAHNDSTIETQKAVCFYEIIAGRPLSKFLLPVSHNPYAKNGSREKHDCVCVSTLEWLQWL